MRMTSVNVALDPLGGGEAYRMDLSFLRAPPPPVGPVRRG